MSKPRKKAAKPSPREDDDAARDAALARYDALRERGEKLEPARRAVLQDLVVELIECGDMDVAAGILDELLAPLEGLEKVVRMAADSSPPAWYQFESVIGAHLARIAKVKG